MFKLIKTVAEKLINSWQRTKQTKMNRGTTKTGDGQITPTSQLIAHKLPRKRAEGVNEEVSIPEQVVGIRKQKEVTEGIRISGSNELSIAADIREDGSGDSSIRGKSRQGETGNTEICQVLINRLNRDGANWGRPIDLTKITGRLEDGIDCEAKDGSKALKIQVTRAERDKEFWGKLNRSHEVNKSISVEAVADALRDAIKAKADRLCTAQQREELILALDATETPSHAFQQVIDSFRNRQGSWAVELGFRAIWVVGPNETLTSRLDEQVHSKSDEA